MQSIDSCIFTIKSMPIVFIACHHHQVFSSRILTHIHVKPFKTVASRKRVDSNLKPSRLPSRRPDHCCQAAKDALRNHPA